MVENRIEKFSGLLALWSRIGSWSQQAIELVQEIVICTKMHSPA